jgi:hypothetical protein
MSPDVQFRIRPKNYAIERFGDRVRWIIQNLEASPRRETKIDDLSELWLVLKEPGDLDLNEKTWTRSVSPTQKHRVPDPIIQALLRTFPELPESVLLAPSFAEFERHALPITAARRRWEDAVRFLALDRELLAKVGKQYHASVDADKAFPIIVQPGWILPKPIELSENSPLPLLDLTVKELPARRLEGLNVDFVQLRISMMKRGGHAIYNGDSYRALDVRAKSGRLDLTFGPTEYFQVVNSCEATAAELADFVRRNPNSIPDALELRGPPAAIFDFKNRSTYVVVNCLLIIKNYSVNTYSRSRYSDQFVLHERSEDTLESQNCISVVPAGGHQPIAADFGDHREVSLWRTVVREFCEELFNKEEAVRLRRHGESFLDLPEVKPYVDAIFRKGAARVYLMGVGIEPVATKCEFLIAIVVDWREAAQRMILKIEENWEGKVKFYDLTKERLLAEANRPRLGKQKPLYPSTKACLLLGHRHFDFLMSKKA